MLTGEHVCKSRAAQCQQTALLQSVTRLCLLQQVYGGARPAGEARLRRAAVSLRFVPLTEIISHMQSLRMCCETPLQSRCLVAAQVQSFGVGGHVKLPGPSAQEPNVYTFGTPYADILDDLRRKDEDLYTQNRLLQASPAVLLRTVKTGRVSGNRQGALGGADAAAQRGGEAGAAALAGLPRAV